MHVYLINVYFIDASKNKERESKPLSLYKRARNVTSLATPQKEEELFSNCQLSTSYKKYEAIRGENKRAGGSCRCISAIKPDTCQHCQ